MQLVLNVLAFVVWLYVIVLLVRLVLEWIQVFARDWRPRGPLLVVAVGVYALTDPPLRALRRFIPPLTLGQVRLDLSFIVLMLGCWILLGLLTSA